MSQIRGRLAARNSRFLHLPSLALRAAVGMTMVGSVIEV
jgi:hypothetical protein